MKTRLIPVLAVFLLGIQSFGQTTYTWNRTTSGAWTTSTNWTPTRSITANTDILVFNNGGVDTATAVPTQTIGQLVVTGNTSILLQATNNRTVTVNGGTGTDFKVDAGSSLLLGGANAITLTLRPGTTGTVAGSITFSGGGHRLRPADAGSVTFASGGTFTQGSGSTGNPFSTSGTANVIVFAAGSALNSQAGLNPFGLTQPSSKVRFQTGSLYSHQQAGTPDFNGRTYANFQLNRSGVTLSPTGANALSIDTLTLVAGNLSPGMTGAFAVKGAISVASGSTLTFSPASASTLTFSGAGTQRISGPGAIIFQTNQNVAVNGGGVLIDRDISILGALTMKSGNVTLGSGNLAVGSTVSGAGAGKAIVTSGLGVLKRSISPSARFQFPVSPDGASYNPITIALAVSDVADTFAVAVQQGVNPSAPDNQTAVQRTWTIYETAGNDSNATLTFQWDVAQEGTLFSRSAAGVWRYDGSSWVEPSAGTTNGTGPYTLASALPLKTFGTYIIGNDGALPITLSSFTAVDNGTHLVILNWATISEVDNYGFEVERSTSPNGPFSVISPLIPGHGTTNVAQHYSFTDGNSSTRTMYYRLKQTDLDKTIRYSDPIMVNRRSEPTAAAQGFALCQNYPNPFNPSTEVRFSVEVTGPATLVVYNAIGQIVATLFDGIASTGREYTTRLDGSRLASGVYFYRLNSGSQTNLRKMVLLK